MVKETHIPVSKTLYKSFYWKALQFFISFLLNLFLARCFQAVIIAEFHSILYIFSFIASFFTLGLDLGITYYITRNELTLESARIIIIYIVLISLLITLPLVYYLYLNNNSLYHNISKQSVLFFATLYISGTLLSNLSTAIYTAHNQNYYPVRISFLLSCVLLTGSFILSMVFAGRILVQSLLIIYFTIFFFQGLLTYLLTFKIYRTRNQATSINIKLLRKIIKFSFTGYVISLLFFVGLKVNVLILSYWVPNYELGNYTQSYKLTEYIITLVGFIAYPLIAVISQQSNESRKNITLFLLRICNTFTTIIILILALTGYWVFPFIFGSSFTKMYIIFIFFIPGLMANCASVFFTSYYFGSGQLRYNLINAILLLLTSIIFFLLLVNKLGVNGAALAFSISGSISLAYDLFAFKKLNSFSIKEILFINVADFKRIKKIIISGFYNR